MCITGQIGGKDLRTRITATEHYKSLSKMLQNLTRSTNNVRKINDALVQIENTSFEAWEARTNFRHNNKEIIKELIK